MAKLPTIQPRTSKPQRPSDSPGAWENSLAPDHYIDYSRYMDINTAVDALEALAHETRLSVFRLLVQAGAEGLSAGAIAERLDARQNTMSSHLAKLHRAGIVTSQRHGRHIIYRADFEAVGGLILYLLEDCCGRSAELCEPIVAAIKC